MDRGQSCDGSGSKQLPTRCNVCVSVFVPKIEIGSITVDLHKKKKVLNFNKISMVNLQSRETV